MSVIGRINRLLASAWRTDLIGPEMWTVPGGVGFDGGRSNEPDLRRGAPVEGGSAQWPAWAWHTPQLGMPGTWCYGHQTEIHDLLTISIDVQGTDGWHPLALVPTRNDWTPAHLTTHFRSLPSGRADEYRHAGELCVRQRTCVTRDNVFVAELHLSVDGRRGRRFRVRVLTPSLAREGDDLRVRTRTIGGGLGQQITIDQAAALAGPTSTTLDLAPGGSQLLRLAFAVDPGGVGAATARAEATRQAGDPFAENEAAFEAWFARNVPQLRTDDLDLLRLYYYRWFVVYRNHHHPRRVLPGHPYERPAFYESPSGSWFGCTIGLSVPMQLEESAWLRDPTPSRDHLLNWAGPTHPQYRNYIQWTPRAIWTVQRHHPDPVTLASVYGACRDFALAKVDPIDPSRLPVQVGSWMTGAEYQPNFYQFTDPQWDWRRDLEGEKTYKLGIARSVRLDTAVHQIANLRASARMAGLVGRSEEAARLEAIASAQLRRLVQHHWDDRLGLFLAADPDTGHLADQAACYDSFCPFMWGLVTSAEHLRSFEKLTDEAWFWDEFPATTAAKNCPMYWAGNCLTGPAYASESEPHPYDCSWNGPPWHFSNTIVAEALGAAASTDAGRHLRPVMVEFMRRWGDMHFFYGDRSTPCSVEHVRASDGARFRSVVDYFHSGYLAPLLRHWAGVRISDNLDGVTFDPMTTAPFELIGVPVLGRLLDFRSDGAAGRSLRADEKVVAETPTGDALIWTSRSA